MANAPRHPATGQFVSPGPKRGGAQKIGGIPVAPGTFPTAIATGESQANGSPNPKPNRVADHTNSAPYVTPTIGAPGNPKSGEARFEKPTDIPSKRTR